MNAKRVKSARARATVAARLLKTVKPWPRGYGLGRSFDDCFEMGDGGEVKRLLLEKAKTDPELLSAMLHAHADSCGSWGQEVLASKKSPTG